MLHENRLAGDRDGCKVSKWLVPSIVSQIAD